MALNAGDALFLTGACFEAYRGEVYVFAYVLALTLGGFRTPSYHHHRDVRAIRSGLRWLRGA